MRSEYIALIIDANVSSWSTLSEQKLIIEALGSYKAIKSFEENLIRKQPRASITTECVDSFIRTLNVQQHIAYLKPLI